MKPYLLLFVGLLLIFLECYLPGAVMGISGSVLLLLAVILFSMDSKSLFEVLLFIIGTLIAVFAVIRLALWHIRSTGRRKTIFLDSDQEGYRASSFDAHLMGKTGKALADMRPGGYVLIDGKKYQAISVSGFIPQEAEIEVISGQGESLIVRQKEMYVSSGI